MRLLAMSLLASASLALAGCGGQPSESDPAGTSGSGSQDALGHIHGLGINPAGGGLMIATHYGLFEARPGSTKATRVGDSRQDVMGFTVIGPNRFLGSGHPAEGQNLPPLLGLIESTNAGLSWEPISLESQADFHVLRAAGRRVYGVNSGDAVTLTVSSDTGRTWDRRGTPGQLIDLAIDPGDAERVVGSSEEGLFHSPDGGRNWKPANDRTVGLLAWPRPRELYWIDGGGAVRLSADEGRSWRETGGTIGGQPAAFSAHGQNLYAALADGTVKESTDSGRTWSVRAAP